MNFIETAAARETSPEVMEAIWYVSGRNEAVAARVWESPTEPEMIAIWERVTVNGLKPSSRFFWGAAGSDWATNETEGK